MGKVKSKCKQTFMIDIIIPLFALIVTSSGLFYLISDSKANQKFKNRLEKKVEETADVNSNGLDIKEISEVYEKLEVNPVNGFNYKYFNLSISEMQKYLRKMGKFDPKTDTYGFKDDLKKK